jgi:hypothetical protein
LEGLKDFFLPSQKGEHRLTVNYRPSSTFISDVNANTDIEPIFVNQKAPFISELYSKENPEGTIFHSGEVLVLGGFNLKCDPTAQGENGQPDEGVFFVSTDMETEGQEFRCSVMISNTEKSLVIKVPELEPGEYELEVRSRCGNHKLRAGEWELPLIIQ